jgi:hypothetical protein
VTDPAGRVLITPECASLDEIEGQINALHVQCIQRTVRGVYALGTYRRLPPAPPGRSVGPSGTSRLVSLFRGAAAACINVRARALAYLCAGTSSEKPCQTSERATDAEPSSEPGSSLTIEPRRWTAWSGTSQTRGPAWLWRARSFSPRPRPPRRPPFAA